jgi:predicted DNA-binding protein
MKVQDIKYLSFPVPTDFHKSLKTLASSQGKTYKGLLVELVEEYMRKEENQKILIAMK